MNFQAARPTPFWRGFLATTIVILAIGVSACSNRLALPGLQPTAQPVAAAQDERFNPTLTLDPPSGYAGVYVQVNGAGWPPNMMVVVVLTDPNGISTTVASKDTDSTGNLTTGFLYPIDSRWLLDVPYTISAESADGKYRAAAGFAVVEPGTEATPPTGIPPAAPTAVPTNAIAAAPTATAVPTSTPTAVPTETPLPQPTATPSPEAQTVEAAPDAASQSPVVTAALVPNDDRPDRRFRVEVATNDPNNQLQQVVAILAIPSIGEVDDVRLKERDKFDVKVNKERLEINARDPKARLDTILAYGGIEVRPGQEIDYRHSSDHKFRARFDGDTLRVEAPTLLLQVFAVDAAGQSYEVTASPPSAPDDGEDDDRDDNDRDRDRDDNRRDDRGRGNRDDRGRDNDDDDD